jgi:type I restriction enzyme S subunit
MGLKVFTTDFQFIGEQEFLRPNFGYRYFFDIQKAKVYENSKTIKLKSILTELPSTKVSKGELEDFEILVDLENIERRFNNLVNLDEVSEIGSDKTILQDGDIVIPKMQPQMGNIFLNLEHKRYVASTELLEYKINNSFNPIYLYYLITSSKFLSDLGKLESGKTHRRVNPVDLLKIRIPLISKEKQDQIVKKIQIIEQVIKTLKSTIIPAQEIINKVFARKFGFDLASFEELKHQSHFYLDLSNVALSKDLRSAVKFNSNKYDFLKESIFKKSTFREVINLSNTTLGRQITPNFIIEESDYYYINANSLKNFVFDETVLTPIDVKFFDKNKHLQVEQNDILLVASGEGSIGKSAIFNSELYCITSQFVMKIGLKKNVNVQYIHYYMQSIFFQLTVEKFKKGMGNMTNIFVSQLKDFPILLSENQQKIVDEIKIKLDKQEAIKKAITEERNKIDEIIENSIRDFL